MAYDHITPQSRLRMFSKHRHLVNTPNDKYEVFSATVAKGKFQFITEKKVKTVCGQNKLYSAELEQSLAQSVDASYPKIINSILNNTFGDDEKRALATFMQVQMVRQPSHKKSVKQDFTERYESTESIRRNYFQVLIASSNFDPMSDSGKEVIFKLLQPELPKQMLDAVDELITTGDEKIIELAIAKDVSDWIDPARWVWCVYKAQQDICFITSSDPTVFVGNGMAFPLTSELLLTIRPKSDEEIENNTIFPLLGFGHMSNESVIVINDLAVQTTANDYICESFEILNLHMRRIYGAPQK